MLGLHQSGNRLLIIHSTFRIQSNPHLLRDKETSLNLSSLLSCVLLLVSVLFLFSPAFLSCLAFLMYLFCYCEFPSSFIINHLGPF